MMHLNNQMMHMNNNMQMRRMMPQRHNMMPQTYHADRNSPLRYNNGGIRETQTDYHIRREFNPYKL